MLKNLLHSGATVALLLATTAAASAFQSNDVVDRLKAQIQLQGLELSVGNVREEGSGLTLENLTFGADGADAFSVDTLSLEDISEGANGGFNVGRMSIPAFDMNNDGVDISFGGVAVTGYFIAGPDETDPMRKGNLYEGMEIGAVTVDVGGKTAFSMSGATASMSPYSPGSTLDYDMTISDMMIDFSTSPDAQTRAVMEALGYSQLKGEVTGAGSWNTDNGLLTMSPLKIAAQDAADLSFELALGGYTPALVGGMQDMQATMADNPQAMSMAMLGLAQQLDIRQMAITLDDNSLTGRLLEFFGAQQGMDAAGAAAFAKGMLPLGLAQLGNAEFAQMAAGEIGKFLDDPQSLRIEAAPAEPVPMAQIMAGATSNPASLLDTLAVTVKGN